MENKLTEYGEWCVKADLNDALSELGKTRETLASAERRYAHMQQVSACDHELEVLGGIELIQTKCNKCNYSWYD